MKAVIAIGIGCPSIVFESAAAARKHFHTSSKTIMEHLKSGEPFRKYPYALDYLFEGGWTAEDREFAAEYRKNRQSGLAARKSGRRFPEGEENGKEEKRSE